MAKRRDDAERDSGKATKAAQEAGRPPLAPDDAIVTAWARLMRVSQAVLSAVEADLKQAGFPPLAHYDALLELRRAGANGLRPFELQRKMLLAQYNVSRLVDRLEQAGHLVRSAAQEDGRGQTLTLTPAGRKLLERMWPAYSAAIARNFGDGLGTGEAETLAELLGRVRFSG